MAMTFSSKGCRDAASSLTKSANTLDSLLNGTLTSAISKAKTIYESETASELYAAFDKLKAKFPDFIKSVTDCSNYLTVRVAPAYEKLEQTASSKIN